MIQSKPVPFVIANAFTKDPFGGNPAAIIFLESELPSDTLQSLAQNFNQPMATFLIPIDSSSDSNPTERTYNVRWFTVTTESAICGHGTLAAAGAIFSLGLVPASVTVLNFVARSGAKLIANKVGDWVEITLPASVVKPIEGDEAERLKGVVQKAFGSPPVNVKFVGSGGVGFEHQFFAEIDEGNDLGGRVVDTSAFVSFTFCGPEVSIRDGCLVFEHYRYLLSHPPY